MSDFYDILFIDDMARNQEGNDDAADLEEEESQNDSATDSEAETDKKFISKYFHDEEKNVKLVKTFFDACETVVKDKDRYNLVVFDLDLSSGFDGLFNDEKKKSTLKDMFSKRNLNFDLEAERESDYKTSGFLLYLLLRYEGYPSSRMMILTANSKKDATAELKKKCSEILLDKLIIRKQDIEGKDYISKRFFSNKHKDDSSYREDNSYYRVRRLVLHACDYWLNQIGSNNPTPNNEEIEEKIPFNLIYGLYRKGNKSWNIGEFTEALERLKMFFPAVQPSKTEVVYYQAAREICMFHEKRADIMSLKSENDTIYKYHAVCRFFRNLSAHHKFKEKEISAELFVLLLCIVLRTYFDNGQKADVHTSSFTKALYEYETEYFRSELNCNEENFWRAKEAKKTVKNTFKDNELIKYDPNTKKYKGKSINDLLMDYFCNKNPKILPSPADIFYMLILYDKSSKETGIYDFKYYETKNEFEITWNTECFNHKKLINRIEGSQESFELICLKRAYKLLFHKK